jgi:hypothetical protein
MYIRPMSIISELKLSQTKLLRILVGSRFQKNQQIAINTYMLGIVLEPILLYVYNRLKMYLFRKQTRFFAELCVYSVRARSFLPFIFSPDTQYMTIHLES